MTVMQPMTGHALTALLLLASCGSGSAEGGKRPVPVKVRGVDKNVAGADTRYSGTLEPASRVDMSFRVSGYVETLGESQTSDGKKRQLEKGDWVKKGAVLARVRSSDYSQRLAGGRAAVTEARAAATLAQQNFERAKNLYEAKAISESEFDAQKAQYDTARANVDSALAQANQAGIALADTVLSAPMDGVILARHVEVGTLVSPGAPGFTIADTRTVKAVFGAPQALVERLHPGSPLHVYVGAEGDVKGSAKIAATVTRIAPAAESSGRVFSVEASLPNEDGGLRVGSVISVRVPEAALTAETLVVPIAAVVRSPKNPHGFAVFVLEGNGDRAPARLHEVRLGEVIGNGVIVMEGIAAGQRVVTRGATLLHDGDEAVVIR